MKKILIIALLALGVVSLEAKGGSAGGAFAGSFIGSSMGTAISNNRGGGGGNCDRYEAQIEKYEDKNNDLRNENSRLVKAINSHRGLLPELEDDFSQWIDDFDEDL